MKITNKLWLWLALLILISPLGLILPHYFKSKFAWGEWGIDELSNLVGYIPSGIRRLSGIWSSPIPDYAFKGWEDKGWLRLSVSYIISAFVGAGITVIIVLWLGKKFAKKGR